MAEVEEELTGEVVEARAAVTPATRAQGTAVVRQAAAVAAGSFAAGLATVAAVKLASGGRSARRARRARKALPVVATRSFLVDVHVLDPRR
jgi:hypothetical protein